MTDIYRCMIVTAAMAAQAASICAQLGGEAGAGMFVTELSATGAAPATHKISSGPMPEAIVLAMDDAAVMHSMCQAQEIDMSLQDCIDLRAAMRVSTENVWVEMSSMGLQIVAEEA